MGQGRDAVLQTQKKVLAIVDHSLPGPAEDWHREWLHYCLRRGEAGLAVKSRAPLFALTKIISGGRMYS